MPRIATGPHWAFPRQDLGLCAECPDFLKGTINANANSRIRHRDNLDCRDWVLLSGGFDGGALKRRRLQPCQVEPSDFVIRADRLRLRL
jgi:hypothetical protein